MVNSFSHKSKYLILCLLICLICTISNADAQSPYPDEETNLIIEAVRQHFPDASGISLDTSDIDRHDEWSLAKVLINTDTIEEGGSPALILVITREIPDTTEVFVESDRSFSEIVSEVPDELISPEAKSILGGRSDFATMGDGSAQLSLPWATGETWAFTSGPHHYLAYNQRPWSSIDFAGGSGQVRAAAGGIFYSSECFVRIEHGNGWSTGYFHLNNVQGHLNGQAVTRGQYIGNTSTCSASSAHVHFSLMTGPGAYAEISGRDIGGWTIYDGNAQYEGRMVRLSDGLTRYASAGWTSTRDIYNDGSIGSGGSETAPANTNLVTNGNFSNGFANWETSGNAVYDVNGGVLYIGRDTTGENGAFNHFINYRLTRDQPYQVAIDLSNTDDTSRNVAFLAANANREDISICRFSIPPNTSAKTYILRSTPTKTWERFKLQIYTYVNDGEKVIGVDNVRFVHNPEIYFQDRSSDQQHIGDPECVEPAPYNQELVVNGDFSNGDAEWTFVGDAVVHQVMNGVMRLGVGPGDNGGWMNQRLFYTPKAGDVLEARLDLGNNFGEERTVVIRLRDRENPDQNTRCTFKLPPQSELKTYIVRMRASEVWGRMRIDVDTGAIRDSELKYLVDNISVINKPDAYIASGDFECVEPAPSNTELIVNGDFSNGDTNWSFVGDAVINQVVNGVMRLGVGPGDDGGWMVQRLFYTPKAGDVLEARLDLGNDFDEERTVVVSLRDRENPNQNTRCAFILPPQSELKTYIVRMRASEVWGRMRIDVDTGTIRDSELKYLVDNVSVQYRPELQLPADETVCTIASPMDYDSNGMITPSDAAYVINRVGTTDSSADLNTDGIVTEVDVNMIIEQIGNELP